MTKDEIFARIASDVANCALSVRGITIWMTEDLFNQLCPKEFALQKDNTMITLFGCKVRVVLFPYDGMRWIVGNEGMVEEDES